MTSGMVSVVSTLRFTLYDKPQMSTADVTKYDMGHRLRLFYGIATDDNVTVSSADVQASRKHSRMLKPFL
jgi:hypothetical protein